MDAFSRWQGSCKVYSSSERVAVKGNKNMKNRIYLLVVLFIAIIALLVLKHQKPEVISLVAPKGYEKAHKIIVAKEDTTFRSALDYANSFAQEEIIAPVTKTVEKIVAFHPPMVFKALVKEAPKKVVNRQIAKAKLATAKKHSLLAKR